MGALGATKEKVCPLWPTKVHVYCQKFGHMHCVKEARRLLRLMVTSDKEYRGHLRGVQSITASVDVVKLTENDGSILIFVYGTANSKAEHVYKTILSHSLQK